MPLWYKSPSIEHLSVRKNVGLFDVSHMGRILVKGEEAVNLLAFLLTNDCRTLRPLKNQVSLICNDEGGIIDDIMVLRLKRKEFLLIVNAINKDKDLNWLSRFTENMEVTINDITEKVSMLAVQGPKARRLMEKVFNIDVESLKRLNSLWAQFDGKKVLISRTGYTGEDGFELYLFENFEEREALELWNVILHEGKKFGIEACGLAARDTLRIEAGFCLYGNELDEKTSPVEAGLNFAIKLDNHNFIGKDIILKQLKEGPKKVRVGFRLLQRGVPRKGMKIFSDKMEIGQVTSGTFSPLLRVGIGMGYVAPEYSERRCKIQIDIRGRKVEAEIVNFPFYAGLQEDSVCNGVG